MTRAVAADSADKFTMSVRALRAAQRVGTPELCSALHMSRATFYERMNGSVGWSLEDAVTLADLFKVPLADMVAGIGSSKVTDQRLPARLAASTDVPEETTPRRGHLVLVKDVRQ